MKKQTSASSLVMAGVVGSKMPAHKVDIKERLERNSVKEPMSGCWLWLGSVNHQGYGKMTMRINSVRGYSTAHREAYRAYRGEIEEGKMVLHQCDVASCCNPDHLYLGTASENQKDRFQRSKRFARNTTNGRFESK